MSAFWIILIVFIYYVLTRFVGSLILNLNGTSIDDFDHGVWHYVLWLPVVAEVVVIGFILLMILVALVEGVKWAFLYMNHKIERLSKAIQARF